MKKEETSGEPKDEATDDNDVKPDANDVTSSAVDEEGPKSNRSDDDTEYFDNLDQEELVNDLFCLAVSQHHSRSSHKKSK